MIQITNETKLIKDSKFLKDKSTIGQEVDNSLTLERLDKNNLVLKRAGNPINYFGDVRVALTRSLNYAIKGSEVALSLEFILKTIDTMDNRIKQLEDTEV